MHCPVRAWPPVSIAASAGLFSLDVGIAAFLESFLAAAAACADQILQTRRRVLRQRGLGKDQGGGERSRGIGNDTMLHGTNSQVVLRWCSFLKSVAENHAPAGDIRAENAHRAPAQFFDRPVIFGDVGRVKVVMPAPNSTRSLELS